MAGQTHAVDIGDDDLLPPWTTVFEVARAIDVSDWVLVGGLMVQLHAHRASIPPPRATKDVDLIADVQTNQGSFGSIGSALTGIGFEVAVPDARTSPIYRFIRGEEQVDVMVADHLPSEACSADPGVATVAPGSMTTRPCVVGANVELTCALYTGGLAT